MSIAIAYIGITALLGFIGYNLYDKKVLKPVQKQSQSWRTRLKQQNRSWTTVATTQSSNLRNIIGQQSSAWRSEAGQFRQVISENAQYIKLQIEKAKRLGYNLMWIAIYIFSWYIIPLQEKWHVLSLFYTGLCLFNYSGYPAFYVYVASLAVHVYFLSDEIFLIRIIIERLFVVTMLQCEQFKLCSKCHYLQCRCRNDSLCQLI